MIGISGHDVDLARLLVTKGADINAQNSRQLTPLYLTSFNGHEDIVRYLLSAGADQGLPDIDGR